MVNLTFGEQVKIILNRKGMTIKDLAELIEERTGMKMSRQNLTQRLSRDNFQEQDMRQIADILGCPFYLNILTEDVAFEKAAKKQKEKPADKETKEEETAEAVAIPAPREITVGDLLDLAEVRAQAEAEADSEKKDEPEEKQESGEKEKSKDEEKQQQAGEINPYTRREYETNSVRMHPKRIGYVQVYDQAEHKWTDMTEWAFLGEQDRKKRLLGKKYKPPVYLD